jgi:hypothetical protein
VVLDEREDFFGAGSVLFEEGSDLLFHELDKAT